MCTTMKVRIILGPVHLNRYDHGIAQEPDGVCIFEDPQKDGLMESRGVSVSVNLHIYLG